MKKYVGKYRVTCEFDWNNLRPMDDDPYIICKNEGQIFRYKDDVLKYYVGKRKDKGLISTFRDAGIHLVDEPLFERFDTEITFLEHDLDIVAALVGARTKGAAIKPNSKRNLRLFAWYRNGTYKQYYKNRQRADKQPI